MNNTYEKDKYFIVWSKKSSFKKTATKKKFNLSSLILQKFLKFYRALPKLEIFSLKKNQYVWIV